MNTFARILVLASAGLVAASAPAFAHAHLKSSTPAADSIVATAPTELDLTFSEGVNLKFTGVKVTGPAKTAVATGNAALGASSDTTLVVPLSDILAAGSYTVAWHALSTDGHKTSGTYTFTIKP
ncbi:copper homeostasis periplasmic binding protein CopC [Lichenifustis flavocetrariae]|uniref:Copper homeostasis periplasmic binding protein CopC n=1 Tax=Lichenifustis flavocetrariae TaxID=2949735 RepID=A0AA41YXD0_9HYPH|nr:copper homeostasis periplasmic binding protein CopC [Lichenifustis flavocetrariae]MCW6506580.1 copper homeostasis periplasmic binding protein CopC [Lichenifustis flavocetrariae]